MTVRWSDEKDLGGLTNLQELTKLEQLDLDGDMLTRFPSELCQLTNLRELGLSQNQLAELPAEIGQLTNLEKLNLRGNRLTELPRELGQLTSLQELDLQGNPWRRRCQSWQGRAPKRCSPTCAAWSTPRRSTRPSCCSSERAVRARPR
jgi:hypothetical protein